MYPASFLELPWEVPWDDFWRACRLAVVMGVAGRNLQPAAGEGGYQKALIAIGAIRFGCMVSKLDILVIWISFGVKDKPQLVRDSTAKSWGTVSMACIRNPRCYPKNSGFPKLGFHLVLWQCFGIEKQPIPCSWCKFTWSLFWLPKHSAASTLLIHVSEKLYECAKMYTRQGEQQIPLFVKMGLQFLAALMLLEWAVVLVLWQKDRSTCLQGMHSTAWQDYHHNFARCSGCPVCFHPQSTCLIRKPEVS